MINQIRRIKENASKREEGFTLIELLIVILILGILAAIVVVALTGTSEDARTKACSDDARNVYNALNNYVIKNGNVVPISSGVNGTDFLSNPVSGGPAGSQKSFSGATMKAVLFNTNSGGGGGGQYGELTKLVPAYISKIPNDVAVYYLQSQDPNNKDQFQYTYAVGPNPNIAGSTDSTFLSRFLPESPLSIKAVQECVVAGL